MRENACNFYISLNINGYKYLTLIILNFGKKWEI